MTYNGFDEHGLLLVVETLRRFLGFDGITPMLMFASSGSLLVKVHAA